MRIRYAPFIDKEVILETVKPPDLEGVVLLQGHIGAKPASLALSTAEAARIFRALKAADIEALESVYAAS